MALIVKRFTCRKRLKWSKAETQCLWPVIWNE